MAGKKSSVKLHHIAITTSHPERLALFYAKLPGFPEPQVNFSDSGKVRSVWFTLAGVIFMIEKGKKCKAPEALVFQLNPRSKLIKTLEKSAYKSSIYTLYIYDPDGNTVGFSSYPKSLKK